MNKPWSKENIILCRDAGGDRIVLCASPIPPYDGAKCIHPFPGLLSLGIVLLELELMKSIESARQEEVERLKEIRKKALHESEGQGSGEERNANTDLCTALLMFKSVREQAMRTFANAILACLTFRREQVKPSKDSTPGQMDRVVNIGLQRKIYEQVVQPLERELAVMFPSVNLDGLNSLPVLFLDASDNHGMDGLGLDLKNASIQSYAPSQVNADEAVLFDEHEHPASETDEG